MNNFLSIIDTWIYYLEYNIQFLLINQLQEAKPTILIILFISGLITSLNPCFFPIFAIAISYIYGNNEKLSNKYMLISGLLTSFLIVLIFTLLINYQSHKLVLIMPIFSAFFMILIGLNLLKIFNLSKFFFKTGKNPNFFNVFLKKNRLYNYLSGIIIGLSSIPCNGPIILTITFWISHCQNNLIALIYVLFYFSGYIFPIYSLIRLKNYRNSFNLISSTLNTFNYVGGSFILGFGIFSLLQKIFI